MTLMSHGVECRWYQGTHSTMRSNSNPKAKGKALRQNLRKPQGSARRSEATDPPQLSVRIKSAKTFRLQASSAQVNVNLSTADIIGICGITASTAILGHAHASAIRVKRIQMWAVPTASGPSAASICSMIWSANTNGLPTEVSDLSITSARCAHISTAPPKESLASFWQNANNALNLISGINLPIGGIMDITVEFMKCDSETPQTYTLVGATAGNVYYKTPSASLTIVSLQTL